MDALEELADRTVKRGTGARGLRALMEKLMLDVMFEIPSAKKIRKCQITADTVTGKAKPKLS